jgi:hypothetical protein
MFHLHGLYDVVHEGTLDVIIELLNSHISRVNCHCLVESHRDSIWHDNLDIASHLGYSHWVWKNKLHRFFVSLLCHRYLRNLIFRIHVAKHILIECIKCSLTIDTQRPYRGE